MIFCSPSPSTTCNILDIPPSSPSHHNDSYYNTNKYVFLSEMLSSSICDYKIKGHISQQELGLHFPNNKKQPPQKSNKIKFHTIFHKWGLAPKTTRLHMIQGNFDYDISLLF